MAKPKDLSYIFIGLLGVGVALNYLKDKIQLPGIAPPDRGPPPPGTEPEPTYGEPSYPWEAPVSSYEPPIGIPGLPPQEAAQPYGAFIPIGEISTGESIRALTREEQAYFPPETVVTVGGQVLRPEEQAQIAQIQAAERARAESGDYFSTITQTYFERGTTGIAVAGRFFPTLEELIAYERGGPDIYERLR